MFPIRFYGKNGSLTLIEDWCKRPLHPCAVIDEVRFSIIQLYARSSTTWSLMNIFMLGLSSAIGIRHCDLTEMVCAENIFWSFMPKIHRTVPRLWVHARQFDDNTSRRWRKWYFSVNFLPTHGLWITTYLWNRNRYKQLASRSALILRFKSFAHVHLFSFQSTPGVH
jgi:hypothetical protein